MKKLVLSFIVLLIATFVSVAQTTINFDDAAKWTQGEGSTGLGSYAINHVYSDGVFSATGGPALRNSNTAQDGFPGAIGTYSWRLTNATASWIVNIATGGVAEFSLKARRWDGTPSPNYLIDYSIDGIEWINIATINNVSLDNSSDWKSFGGIINNSSSNIKIRLSTSGTSATIERIMVDDFTWTGYSAGPAGTLTLTSPVGGLVYETNQPLNFTWTAEDVTKVKFQVQPEGFTSWEDIEELTNIDASLLTIPFTVPIDARGGKYNIRIVDMNNPAVYAESGLFTVIDKHFGGIDEDSFYPANNEEDVPTDLVFGYMMLVFNEEINFGEGSIYLKKGSDNSTVYTYNKNSQNWSLHPEYDGALRLHIAADLAPNTQYYVIVEPTAIIDRATTPNAFAGISNPDAWNFTTGANSSLFPISVVQTPLEGQTGSIFAGQQVKVKGIVMFRNNSGYMLQDNTLSYSGIYIYHPSNAVALGDEVEVMGTVKEYNGLTELDNVTYTNVKSNGNALFAPVEVAAPLSEQWESMLVTMVNLTVNSGFIGSTKEFTVTDGSNNVVVDDFLFAMSAAPANGTLYNSITGFVNDFNGLKLAPRNANDFVIATKVGDEKVQNFAVMSNNGILKVVAEKAISRVEVYGVTGVKLRSLSAKGSSNEVLVNGVNGASNYIVNVIFADGQVASMIVFVK